MTIAESILSVLTDREVDVFRLLSYGLTQREVADRLNLQPRTVQSHSGNITSKFYIRQAHIPILALATGLVTLEELLEHLPEGTRDLIQYAVVKGDEYITSVGDGALEKARLSSVTSSLDNGDSEKERGVRWDPKTSFDGAICLLPRGCSIRIEVE